MTLLFSADDIGKDIRYELTEINDQAANVTYSELKYIIEISVFRDQESKALSATLTVNGSPCDTIRATFENIYNHPELPDTGDHAQIGLFSIIAAVSMLLLCVMLRRKSKMHI